MVPPLLYADDMVLLATSAAGLQRQLDLLQQYCRQWGLTVNIDKTKLMLLSGRRTQHAAQQTADAAGLTFAGQQPAIIRWPITFQAPTDTVARCLSWFLVQRFQRSFYGWTHQ